MLPTYLAEARSVARYHPVGEPHGVLQLSVAENQMLEDLLVPKLSATANFSRELIYYQPTQGRPDARQAMVDCMTRNCSRGEYELDPESLVVGAGCNSVLENLFFCITEPGEGVLVPQPFYAAFKFDLGSRAGVKVLPVPVMPDAILQAAREDDFLEIPASAYYPTAKALERAYQAAIQVGVEPRVVLLTTPNNPLGICYPEEVLAECIDWAEERGLHTVRPKPFCGICYSSAHHTYYTYCTPLILTTTDCAAGKRRDICRVRLR
jgi:aspartate/methionine/tyrosine aminotransferase